MTNTATISRKAIMQEAWASYRKYNRGPFCRRRFGDEMARVWSKAKMAAYKACPINRTRAAISEVESKNHLTQADYARLGVLRAALRAHQEHAEAAPDYAAKRELIEAAGGRFCAVTFIKKDGTERTMQVQPATLKHHVKGDAATDAEKQAVATRKANHPNLLPVWDAQNKAPRSINLATVKRIAVDGEVHNYAA